MKHIKITDRIRMGALLLLLMCIMLPFRSCTKHLDENGKLADISKKPAVESVTTFTYTWEEFEFRDISGWLFLGCFIWPVPILIHRYISHQERLKYYVWLLEPFCVTGASYFTCFLSHLLGKPAIGAYLMQTAYFLFAISWISEVVQIGIEKKRKDKIHDSF